MTSAMAGGQDGGQDGGGQPHLPPHHPHPHHLPPAAQQSLAAAMAAATTAHQQQPITAPLPPPPPPAFQNGLSILAQAASVAKLPASDRYKLLPSRRSLPGVVGGNGLPVRKRLPSSESSGTSYMTSATCNDENSPLNQDSSTNHNQELASNQSKAINL